MQEDFERAQLQLQVWELKYWNWGQESCDLQGSEGLLTGERGVEEPVGGFEAAKGLFVVWPAKVGAASLGVVAGGFGVVSNPLVVTPAFVVGLVVTTGFIVGFVVWATTKIQI